MIEDAITADTFYRELKHRFSELLENEGILKERVDINTRSLTPEEAIGITERRDFIGQTRYGVLVEDGGAPGVSQSICSWADLVLCTGSTVCNGSIVDFLYLKDKILFYGTTLAGAAALLGLPRLCFADRYQ